MSITTTATQDPLRPPATGLKAWLMAWLPKLIPFGFRVLRAVWPIARFRNYVLVTRYDDVREVFLNDKSFRVPWAAKVDVITGGFPFILGMDDTQTYREDTAALRTVVRSDDIAHRLVPEVNRLTEQIVAGAKGELEVVDQLVEEARRQESRLREVAAQHRTRCWVAAPALAWLVAVVLHR